MEKVIYCDEIFPGCKSVARGADETSVLVNLAHHLTEQHGVRDINQDLLRKARTAMHDAAAKEADA